MKKKIGLFFAATLLLAGLSGCSLAGENYYTIDVYSDYVGMEEDLKAHGYYSVNIHDASAMAKVGLKKVGYCYAVKGKDAKIGGIQLADSAFNGRTSTRTPAKGHKYVFDDFVGYYAKDQKIDLSHINANCAVFATFKYELEDYLVSVRDAYDSTLYSERVVFGESATSLKEQGKGELDEVLRSSPIHDPLADPDDYSTWRDAHYLDYTFDKWRFTVDGRRTGPGWDYDSAKDRSRIELSKAQAVDYVYEEGTRIDPLYDTTTKSYDVKISYQVRSFDEIQNEYVYTAPVSLGTQSVEYGKPIDIAALGLDDYTCVGEGKDGVPSRYGDDMDIKAGELTKKLPGTLCELTADGYRGLTVNRRNIAFGCTVTLIFVEKAPVYNLNFHSDCANPAYADTLKVSEGDTFSAPAVTNVPVGKVFAEWGVRNEMDVLVPADLSKITADADYYPILVDEKVVGGELTFSYANDRKGYCLSEIGPTLTELDAAEFDLSIFPKDYPLVGISSFSGPSGVDSEKITRIELPANNGISWIAHGAFANTRLEKIETIDLSASKILSLHSYAFRNLARVHEIDLPSSLYEVGSNLFQNDTNLTAVKIDLSEEETKKRAFSDDWYGDLDPSRIIYNA